MCVGSWFSRSFPVEDLFVYHFVFDLFAAFCGPRETTYIIIYTKESESDMQSQAKKHWLFLISVFHKLHVF